MESLILLAFLSFIPKSGKRTSVSTFRRALLSAEIECRFHSKFGNFSFDSTVSRDDVESTSEPSIFLAFLSFIPKLGKRISVPTFRRGEWFGEDCVCFLGDSSAGISSILNRRYCFVDSTRTCRQTPQSEDGSIVIERCRPVICLSHNSSIYITSETEGREEQK